MIVLINIDLLLAGALLNFVLRLKALRVEMVAVFAWIFNFAGISEEKSLIWLQIGHMTVHTKAGLTLSR
jgi:hypothetical protein